MERYLTHGPQLIRGGGLPPPENEPTNSILALFALPHIMHDWLTLAMELGAGSHDW